MATHVRFIEDSRGDAVEIEHFCSALCYSEHVGESAFGHAYPGQEWPDYDVYCANKSCGELLHEGSDTA